MLTHSPPAARPYNVQFAPQPRRPTRRSAHMAEGQMVRLGNSIEVLMFIHVVSAFLYFVGYSLFVQIHLAIESVIHVSTLANYMHIEYPDANSSLLFSVHTSTTSLFQAEEKGDFSPFQIHGKFIYVLLSFRASKESTSSQIPHCTS